MAKACYDLDLPEILGIWPVFLDKLRPKPAILGRPPTYELSTMRPAWNTNGPDPLIFSEPTNSFLFVHTSAPTVGYMSSGEQCIRMLERSITIYEITGANGITTFKGRYCGAH